MTTFLVPRNNANSKLAAAITAAAPSLTVSFGEGARFPSSFPYHITIDNEILRVTNRSGDTMTVTRAQESTTAAAHKAGAIVQLNITAKAISDLNTAVNALESAPPAHNTSHQSGGADQISLAGLTGEAATPQPPKTHAASHKSGGSDAIKLDELATPDDNTNLNASTTRHGLLLKLSNNAAQFLNGVGSWATPPGGNPDISARAFHSTNHSVNNITWFTVTFDSERFDTDTIHDNVTNNSRLTCRTAGKYLIIGMCGISAHATGERRIAILLNGATYIGYSTPHPNSSQPFHMEVSAIYNLSVNDYVELRVYQASGGAQTTIKQNEYSPEFMMIKIA